MFPGYVWLCSKNVAGVAGIGNGFCREILCGDAWSIALLCIANTAKNGCKGFQWFQHVQTFTIYTPKRKHVNFLLV